jgi:hypothetical protein
MAGERGSRVQRVSESSLRGIATAVAVVAMFASLSDRIQAAEPYLLDWNKAEVLRLSEDARHIVVANPQIVDVTVESPRVIVLFGKRPGETSVSVLDKAYSELFAATVVVTLPNDRHVSVISVARGRQSGMVETTYSCVERCVRVETPGAARPQPAGGARPPATRAAPGAPRAAAIAPGEAEEAAETPEAEAAPAPTPPAATPAPLSPGSGPAVGTGRYGR